MPDLYNATALVADYALGMDADGRERLVVVAKGTFSFPKKDAPTELLPEQVPLVATDQFTGKPGFSATRYESEYAPFKPRCDVLVNGSAHAPGGRPTQRCPVGLRVGSLTRSFQVVGRRQWQRRLTRLTPGEPEPFIRLPISYDVAFGGVDVHPTKANEARAFAANPVGVGFHPLSPPEQIEGRPLPCTEELDTPVESPSKTYQPMSFGALGRNFQERLSFAGTYDDRWLDEVFPLLPADFDPRYHQAAPASQQIPYPQGGESVVLVNLTPEGRLEFQLPRLEVPVEFTTRKDEHTTVQAVLDTLLIEPDERRLQLTWRASLPLRRGLHEVAQVIVGQLPRGFYRAREVGKAYHRSLADLTPAPQDRGGELDDGESE